MNDKELLAALRKVGSEDRHRCLGCGYEHHCTTHGCAVTRAAAERIEALRVELDALRTRREADPPPTLDEAVGLMQKYIVRKVSTGEAVEDCFVLRPKKDWAARYAVRAYADMTCDTKLSDDLLKWVGEEFPVSSYDPEYTRIDQSEFRLKPCPRCGSKGLIVYEGPKYYYAECEHCPLELHEIYFSAEEAAAAWNYRAEKSNALLTLEELREMDGEPVWVTKMDGSGGVWMLVDAEYELCREAHGEMAVFENCGKTWMAYRRKPEEGEAP